MELKFGMLEGGGVCKIQVFRLRGEMSTLLYILERNQMAEKEITETFGREYIELKCEAAGALLV